MLTKTIIDPTTKDVLRVAELHRTGYVEFKHTRDSDGNITLTYWSADDRLTYDEQCAILQNGVE